MTTWGSRRRWPMPGWDWKKLVTEVTMGRAGIVLGIEMSRLARTGRDWHQLLELCSLSGVLLADPDGVYDPGVYNDRLVRHEVLRDRTEVKDHRRRAIAVVR